MPSKRLHNATLAAGVQLGTLDRLEQQWDDGFRAAVSFSAAASQDEVRVVRLGRVALSATSRFAMPLEQPHFLCPTDVHGVEFWNINRRPGGTCSGLLESNVADTALMASNGCKDSGLGCGLASFDAAFLAYLHSDGRPLRRIK